MSQALIAILDIGKTNKKLFLFDEQYRMVQEQTSHFPETLDEDGDPCEDLDLLTKWVTDSLAGIRNLAGEGLRAINFTAYGASFVHIGKDGRPVLPLYNYLKPYPAGLQEKFYRDYGGEVTFSMLTASPVLGSLNSGMQLYSLKHQQPERYEQVAYSLHLPQYISYLVTGRPCSDITSIGCHTNLWNFSQHNYHEWVYREGIISKLAPIHPSDQTITVGKLVSGVGLHDSSAAMIPYLASFRDPFVLISTGTWCISMNPFNASPLTVAELKKDCLCYMTYRGKPVKASRLFAGYDHEQQVQRLATHFHIATDYYTTMAYDEDRVSVVRSRYEQAIKPGKDAAMVSASAFGKRELAAFGSYEEAYYQLMLDIMVQQAASTSLVLDGANVKRIFVDGGFGRNPIYMRLLAAAFPHIEVFAASIPQATALGAALAIHRQWNTRPLPGDLVEIVKY